MHDGAKNVDKFSQWPEIDICSSFFDLFHSEKRIFPVMKHWIRMLMLSQNNNPCSGVIPVHTNWKIQENLFTKENYDNCVLRPKAVLLVDFMESENFVSLFWIFSVLCHLKPMMRNTYVRNCCILLPDNEYCTCCTTQSKPTL